MPAPNFDQVVDMLWSKRAITELQTYFFERFMCLAMHRLASEKRNCPMAACDGVSASQVALKMTKDQRYKENHERYVYAYDYMLDKNHFGLNELGYEDGIFVAAQAGAANELFDMPIGTSWKAEYVVQIDSYAFFFSQTLRRIDVVPLLGQARYRSETILKVLDVVQRLNNGPKPNSKRVEEMFRSIMDGTKITDEELIQVKNRLSESYGELSSLLTGTTQPIQDESKI